MHRSRQVIKDPTGAFTVLTGIPDIYDFLYLVLSSANSIVSVFTHALSDLTLELTIGG